MEPRNTLVTVVEIEQKESITAGGLIQPAAHNPEYKPCKIIKVGPGQLNHKDEISPMLDLKPGQLVLVKLAVQRRIDQNTAGLERIGVDFKDSSGKDLKLVEQSSIVGIIFEPGEWDEDKAKPVSPKISAPKLVS